MISNVTEPAISLVKQAHCLIKERVKPGDCVIDATVGNGRDTRFLLDLVTPNGKIFGFDIQQAAIDSALAFLHGAPYIELLSLINASHAKMDEHIPIAYHGKISAVMFNLGYLPGGDKRIITQGNSTLTALASAKQFLAIDGIISILAYPGHEGGEIETQLVKGWCQTLDPSQFMVKLFENQLDNPSAPKLFVVSKIR